MYRDELQGFAVDGGPLGSPPVLFPSSFTILAMISHYHLN
jgi:hypothetical protein